MWEAFSVGRLPYPGVEPANLLKLLEDGHRLARPSNAACSDDMYVATIDKTHTHLC